jgi:hypothetical protein
MKAFVSVFLAVLLAGGLLYGWHVRRENVRAARLAQAQLDAQTAEALDQMARAFETWLADSSEVRAATRENVRKLGTLAAGYEATNVDERLKARARALAEKIERETREP